MLITCIKPNLSRNQANEKFKKPARQLRRGGLSVSLEFYIPYRLFQVTIKNGGHSANRFVAIDSVTGQLDLYGFDCPPAQADRQTIESEQVLPARINEETAFEIVEEKMKREMYLKGFFKIKGLEVTGRFLETFYLPYYVGLYKRNERVGIEVLNALRGQFEGAKVREVISEWFLSSRKSESDA